MLLLAYESVKLLTYTKHEISRNIKSKKEEKIYSVPLPEELKGFKIPKDIRKFISKIIPNIHQALHARGVHRKYYEDIVVEFIIYMLETSKQGTPRYCIYNPNKYPDIPYYKWFLNQIQYFILQDFKKKKEERAKRTIAIITGEQDNSENFYTNGVVYENSIPSKKGSVFEEVYIKNLPSYLFEFSNSYKENPNSFESRAYELYLSRINGEQNQKFAKKVGVSSATISQWLTKLKVLIFNYLEGDYLLDSSMKLT